MSRKILRLLLIPALFFAVASAQQLEPPQLLINAPPELAALRTRLESAASNRLTGILELVGLDNAGPVIRVSLVPESAELARQVPQWIAGFALGASDEIVIFPARSPQYPHNSLDDVLRHEVTHVLITRAAARQSVPRWFNEGLAMAAERSWGFGDQTRLLYQLVLGRDTSLAEMERLFEDSQSSPSSEARAYALSGALVRDLVEQHGPAAPREILARMRGGAAFDRAFAEITGVTPGEAESDFRQRQRIWTTWFPIITSSATLWVAVTIIALWAIRRRRQKDAALRRKFEEEEKKEDGI